MYVVIYHRITDPRGFKSLNERPQPSRPAHWRLLHSLPSLEGAMCSCLWEADSLEAIRTFTERAYAGVSVCECFEVDHANALGLMARPFTLAQIVAPRSSGG
jgi:hypothetical protein